MANQAREEIGAGSLTVVADRSYYKGVEILACEQAGITTFVPKPLTSGSKAEGRFGKQDFIYLAASDEYGTAPMLAWMVEEKDIEPHVPVWDKTEHKNESFSSNDFHWNEETEEYRSQPATHCAANGEPSKTSVRTSPKPTPSSSDPDRPTARHVR